MEKVRKNLLIAQLFVLSLGTLQVTAENRVDDVHRQLSGLSRVASSAFWEQKQLLNQLSSLGQNKSSTKISIEIFKLQKKVGTLVSGLKQGLELVEAFFNCPENCYALTTADRAELRPVESLQAEIKSNLDLQQRTIGNLLRFKDIIFRVPNLAEVLQGSSIPTGLSSMIENVIKMEDRLKVLQHRLFDCCQQLVDATSALQQILSKHAFKSRIVVDLVAAPSPELPAPPVPGKAPALAQLPELPAPPVPGKAPALAQSPELPAPPVPGKAPALAQSPELPAPPVPGKAPALAPSPELPASPVLGKASELVEPAIVESMTLLEQIRAGIQLRPASSRVLAEPCDDLGALREVLGGRRQAIEDNDEDFDEDEDIFAESGEEQLPEEQPAVRRVARTGESVNIFERLRQQRQFAPSGQADTDNDDKDWN